MQDPTFNSVDFYNLATFLSQHFLQTRSNLTQATIRTCISRAYYASFLLIRDLILMKYKDEIPKTLRQVLKSSKAHKIIARTLELTDAKTAQFFEILRTLRNRADYETGIVLNDRDLNRALNLARELINSVDNIVNTITPKTLYQVLQDLQQL